MRVRVRLFARYREATGQERLDLELPEGGTVEAAWSAVVGRHPVLTPYRPFTLFAVGHDYVQADHALRADDELSLFPPVSGGSAEARANLGGDARFMPVDALGRMGKSANRPEVIRALEEAGKAASIREQIREITSVTR